MDDPRDMPAPGSAERFRADIDFLAWPVWHLAGRLGLQTDRRARRWYRGEEAPPGPVMAWVGKVADFMRANPAPPPPPTRKAGTPGMDSSPILDGMDGTPL